MSMTKATMASFAASATFLWLGARAGAANPKYQLCYSPTYAAWRNFPEPTIDGKIEDDQGWSNAFQYVSGTGALDINSKVLEDFRFLASAHVNANATVDHINLGFRVQNDKTFDNDDLIIIAFQFSASQFGAITLNPIATASGAVAGHPQTLVNYFTSTTGASASWTSHGNGTDAMGQNPWITWAATSGGDVNCTNDMIGNCHWDVEMRVNINAQSVNDGLAAMPPPIASYVGISRVYHVGASPTDGPTEEFGWPPLGPNGEDTRPYDNISGVPPPSEWGKSEVGSTSICGGISFSGADISALSTQLNDPSNNPCSKTVPQVGCLTTLTVNVHNNAKNAQTGDPQTFNDVQAEFLHAPFGGSSFGTFTSIGQSPKTAVPSQASATPLSLPWTPPAASGHECFLAKLSSSSLANGGVTFVNSGEFANMAILPLSEAKIAPHIGVKGLPAPAGGGPQHVRLTTQAYLQFAYADGSLPEIKAGTLVAQLRWVFLVSRDTGRTITIHEHRHEVMDPFSSYGLLLQHALSSDFQTGFEQRHAKLLAEFTSDNKTYYQSPEVRIRLLNAALANDPEKPALSDFPTNIDGVKPVANTGGQLLDVDVPVDGEVTLPTTVGYGAPTPNPGGCCPGSSSSKTTPKVGTLGLIVLVGAVVRRRRRR
jgi:MYXO-CTERM domain-containing protein